MNVRAFLRPWLGSALTWIVVMLLSGFLYSPELSLEMTLVLAYGSIVAMPALSAAVGVLLLREPPRHRVAARLVAGTPVTVVALVLTAVVNPENTERTVAAAGVLPLIALVLLTAMVSLAVGWLRARVAGPAGVRTAGRASYSADGRPRRLP
ncbi:hypothetical protein [Georgenia sp. AZ-5]|uniref:hypothetical protein n=1 Tax=Georgenia sp. AZ-5 TaxID=3367526 RepID=UPI00375449D0